jgi:hypothetical protein
MLHAWTPAEALTRGAGGLPELPAGRGQGRASQPGAMPFGRPPARPPTGARPWRVRLPGDVEPDEPRSQQQRRARGRHSVGRDCCRCPGLVGGRGPGTTSGTSSATSSRRRRVSAAPNPNVATGTQETSTTTGHGARVACAAFSRWQTTWPSMPSTRLPIAENDVVGIPCGPYQAVVQLVVEQSIPVLDAVDAASRRPRVAVERVLNGPARHGERFGMRASSGEQRAPGRMRERVANHGQSDSHRREPGNVSFPS